ncbi:hypothetical protein T440DRAFT_449583 [Plenodomus tracheiphilus IPT5]|uniref:F-box domain-containing protein n=1 Tax=Plenodomus tracheiphilus IPT5 TaxID=1408161 RepID=A0A6A7B9E1_9PLEO|nr:hypothetical protein T440DRAFT_449583 [Plenodomus tracheiphilus IPT5]
MSHPIPTTTTTYSPFLNLPPELRQRIYTHLLTTPHPILGPLARGTQTYSLHTSILRVNHQTHTEARPIFFSQNTFVITSLPSSSDPSTTETDTTSGTGAFEPPLQLADLPLVRSLEIDVLFYPKVLRVLEGRKYGGWSPVCEAAERYVGSLVGVLGAVGESLGELRISADTRRYIPAPLGAHGTTHQTQQPEYARGEEHGELDIRKILTGFHMLDRNPRFREALAAITHVPSIFLHFDFAESYFDFEVERGVLCQQRFAELAGQVLVKRNDIRERLAVREAGGDEDGDVDMESEGIMRIESCREVLECVV